MIIAAAPAFAKGDLVQIGLSGGDLRREIRISASNADFEALRSIEAPSRIPTVRPYLMTLYIDIGSEIVSPPPFEYFPGTRPLLHGATEGPRGGWQAVDRSLARIMNGVITGARAGRVRSARPAEATISSWPLLASWVVPLGCVIAFAARRNRIKTARRIPRATLS